MGEWCAEVDVSSLEDLFMTLRKQAIESKNFENVDKLRAKLTNAGLDVQIESQMLRWYKMRDFPS